MKKLCKVLTFDLDYIETVNNVLESKSLKLLKKEIMIESLKSIDMLTQVMMKKEFKNIMNYFSVI